MSETTSGQPVAPVTTPLGEHSEGDLIATAELQRSKPPLRCRLFGHSWYSVDAAGEVGFCRRCPAQHPQNGVAHRG